MQRYVDLHPIFDALSKNLTIHALTISDNYMEDKDARQLADALLASPNRKLKFLDVGHTLFQEAGAMSLLEVVRSVSTIRAV